MKCPLCEAKIKAFQETCIECGANLQHLDYPQLVINNKAKQRKIITIVLVSVLFLSGGFGTKVFFDDRNAKKIQKLNLELAEAQMKAEKEAAAEELATFVRDRDDYSWVPKGFTKFSANYNLAYKGISYDAANCYETCFGFQLISKDYCSSVRVEGNIERNGVRLDSVSDSAHNVSPGERIVLAMQSSADTPWVVRFSSVTCT